MPAADRALRGLGLFAAASVLIAFNRSLTPLPGLLFVSGLVICVFVEGFFALGAIGGPPIVARAASDAFGGPRAGFVLATGMALALAGALVFNAAKSRV